MFLYRQMRETTRYSSNNRKKCKLTWIAVVLITLISLIPKSFAQSQAYTLSYEATKNLTLSPYYAYVTASGLNIRSGPGMGYSQIGRLFHDEKVRVIAKSGSWLKIQRGSSPAYISANYVSRTSTGSRKSPHFGGPKTVTEQSVDYGPVVNTSSDLDVPDYEAVVTASALNVRKGPGTQYGIYKSIPYNHIVKITHQQGLWSRIKWPDGLAYTHGKYLKRKDPEILKDPESLDQGNTKPPATTSSSGTTQLNPQTVKSCYQKQSPESFISNYQIRIYSPILVLPRASRHCSLNPTGRLTPGQTVTVIAEQGEFVYIKGAGFGWLHKSGFTRIGSKEEIFEPGYGPPSNHITEAAANMGVKIDLPMRGRDVDRDALQAQIVPEITEAVELWFYYQNLVDKDQPGQIVNQQSVIELLYWTPRSWDIDYDNEDIGCIGWDACEAAWQYIKNSDYDNTNLSDADRQQIVDRTKEIAATYCLNTDCSQKFFYRKIVADLQENIVGGMINAGSSSYIPRRQGDLKINLQINGQPNPDFTTTRDRGSNQTGRTDGSRPSRNDFYEPSIWRKNYQDFYSGRTSSTTVPPYSKPNVRWAGKRHPRTGIIFDNRGFPIFDDVAFYDTRFPVDSFKSVSYKSQMRIATRDLRTTLATNSRLRDKFTPEQLRAIQSGSEKIPGFTWHHHESYGRMQLVPETIHSGTKHIGGEAMIDGQ